MDTNRKTGDFRKITRSQIVMFPSENGLATRTQNHLLVGHRTVVFEAPHSDPRAMLYKVGDELKFYLDEKETWKETDEVAMWR